MQFIRKIPRSLVFISLIVLFSTGCATRKAIPLGTIPAPRTPTQSELNSTQQLISSSIQSQGFTLIKKGPEQVRVQKIVTRLAKAAGATDFSYPVLIADAGKDVNAMAVKGNTIVVYKELLNRVKDNNELATVLAHEVAHILARHSEDNGAKKRAETISVASSILGAIAQIALASSGRTAGFARTGGSLTRSTTTLVGHGTYVTQYSRDMEYEADQLGLVLMAKAGFDPNSALAFWSKADKIFGSSGGSFLSSHPSNGNRLNRLKEALPVALPYYRLKSK